MCTCLWDFGHPTPVNYFKGAVATNLMLHVDGNHTKLKNAWLSLLAQPGTLIFRKGLGLKDAGFVLGACEDGVICKTVTCKNVSGKHYICMQEPDADKQWHFKHVLSLDEQWVCQPLVKRAPGCHDLVDEKGNTLGVAVVAESPTVYAIHILAAYRGFTGLKVPYMKKIVDVFGIPVEGSLPHDEFGLAKFLVMHFLPSLSALDLARILEQRKFATKPKIDSLLTGDIVRENADLFDGAECAELAKGADDYKRKVKEYKDSVIKAAAKEAPKGPAPKGTKKKVCAEKDLNAVMKMKEFLPPGSLVSMETEWHRRLRVSMPTALGVEARGACYDDGKDAMRQAFLVLARWSWGVYLEESPSEKCPWNLSA